MKNGMKAMLLSRGNEHSREDHRGYRNDYSDHERNRNYGRYNDRYDTRDYDDGYDERRYGSYEPSYREYGKERRRKRYSEYDDADDDDHSVDEHKARKWVEKMSGGEHYNLEQTEQYRQAHCPDCNKWEFYVAMNAIYSDYHKTAQKFGMDKPEFYAHLTKDFLVDDDAKPDKLSRYMHYIAR